MSEVSKSIEDGNWLSVCQESDLINNIGVCALLNENQVDIFKLLNGDI